MGVWLHSKEPCGLHARRRRLWLSALAIVGALACEKDPPTTGHRVRGALKVQAVMATVGEQLTIVVRYLRTAGPAVELARLQRAVAGAGRLDIPVELDLTSCLVDATREGSPSAGCSVVASVALRDAGGAVLDSIEVGPVDVRDGASVSATTSPIILQAAATLTVEDGGDQLGWPGRALHLPVVVRLTDRAGGAIVGRQVTVVPAMGGGSSIATAPQVTDTGGRVAVGYQLGPGEGAQGFRIETAAGAATLSVPVSLMAVAPRREHVSGGGYYSCAILAGATRCWGGNDGGYLGNRAIAVPGDTLLSVPLSRDPGFVALTANKANNIWSGNTCGLTAAGAVYCWGLAPTGALGVSGSDSCTPFGQAIACNREPTQVPTTVPFVTIDVGGMGYSSGGLYSYPERLCGVSISGDAYCWGENRDGAVGNGTLESRSEPTLVVGGHKWIDITTGMYFSCGITVRAEAYCWGRNQVAGLGGLLGTGDTLSSSVPRRVSGFERFRSVDAGYGSACALTTAGELRCWGIDPPNPGSASTGGFGNSTVPVAPPGPATTFASMSVGAAHACAVRSTSEVYCWGRNRSGSLGDGSPVSASVTYSYSLARVKSSVPLIEVGAAILQTCALAATGDTYCWGVGSRGQLGNGSRNGAGVPAKVTDRAPVAGTPVALQSWTARPRYAARGSTCPNLSVRATDASGYPVVGASIAFHTKTTGATVMPSSVATDALGIASAGCGYAPNAGLNEFVARLGANGDSLVMLTSVLVPGPAARLEDAAVGGGTTAGSGRTSIVGASVQVTDSVGLPVAGVPITFTRMSSSPTQFIPALPATVLTDGNGRAALDSMTPDTIAREDTVRAQVASLPGQAQLLIYSTAAAEAVALRFSSVPLEVRVGQRFSPTTTVTAYDRYGNASYALTPLVVSLTGTSGGVLRGTTVLTPDLFSVSPVYRLSDLSVSAPGTYQLVATVAGLPTAISTPFTVVP